MALRILPVNYLDESTDIAVTPAAVTSMPITYLQSSVSTDVWRSPNLDPQEITGTWGGNGRRISSFALFPGSRGLLGWKVRVRLYADAAMLTAAVYDSGEVDGFTFSGLGWGVFPWGGHPWGVERSDRSALRAPLVLYFTAVTAFAYRITITNGGAVDVPYFEARRMWIADYVEAPYSPSLGSSASWSSNSRQQRTVGGALDRWRGGRWRDLDVQIVLDSEAERQAWADLMYLCDPAVEVVVDCFPESGGRLQRDHIACGSMAAPNRRVVFSEYNLHNLQLAITES